LRALALTDDQLAALKQSAAALPVQRRGDFLQLVAWHMEVEGETADAAFGRALVFARSALQPSASVRLAG
jgi:hypothetical protein